MEWPDRIRLAWDSSFSPGPSPLAACGRGAGRGVARRARRRWGGGKPRPASSSGSSSLHASWACLEPIAQLLELLSGRRLGRALAPPSGTWGGGGQALVLHAPFEVLQLLLVLLGEPLRVEHDPRGSRSQGPGPGSARDAISLPPIPSLSSLSSPAATENAAKPAAVIAAAASDSPTGPNRLTRPPLPSLP